MKRTLTGVPALDRVLGGGVAEQSCTLIAGERGIGKTTLLLQAAAGFAKSADSRVLFISGEQTTEELRECAKRVGAASRRVLFNTVFPQEMYNLVPAVIKRLKVALVIVDTLQTVVVEGGGNYSERSEMLAVVNWLTSLVKHPLGVPVIIASHVNKRGTSAAPSSVEHLVDAVLHLRRLKLSRSERAVSEDARQLMGTSMETDSVRVVARLLLASELVCDKKNRYGATPAREVLRMTEKGFV